MDVYLLGAGFSNDAGVPTMKNFMDGVHIAATAYTGKPEAAVMEAAINFAGSLGLQNIEDLLMRAVNDPVFFDLIWAFGLTIDHCSRDFLAKCQHGGDIGWYEDFAHILSTGNSHIVTFNYDLVLEDVLWWRVGRIEHYGLTFDEVRHKPDLELTLSPVPVLKLHGSVSWLWCLRCHYSVNRYRHVLSVAFEEIPCPRCSFRLIPLMVPPTFRKEVQFGQALYSLWDYADCLFRDADRLIIGGFSFAGRDADFHQRFLSAVEENNSLGEVVLVNRDENTCKTIGSLLPKGTNWRSVSGFAQFCEEEHTGC